MIAFKAVLAGFALKCLGGDMQGRLAPQSDEEVRRAQSMGVDDIHRIFTIDDLVSGDDCIFSATAITQGNILRPVQYFGGGARTETIIMRYKTGTVRFVDTIHKFGNRALSIKL